MQATPLMQRPLPFAKQAFYWTGGLLILLAALFPGDTVWINDEPILMEKSLDALRDGTLFPVGLRAATGIPYGPVSVWLYELFVPFGAHIELALAIKVVCTALVVFGSGCVIARWLWLPRWPLILLLLSPYLIFYSRQIWDNGLLVPGSSLLWLAYLGFCRRPSLARWTAVVAISWALVHIHLMALLTVAPVWGCLLYLQKKFLLKHWKKVALVVAIFLGLSLPYFQIILQDARGAYPNSRNLGSALSFTLGGAKFFSFAGFFNYFLPHLKIQTLWIAAATVACSFFFFLTGWRFIPRYWPQSNLYKAAILLASTSIFLTTPVLFIMRVSPHPHYYNGIFFSYFFFLWLGLSAIWNLKITQWSFSVYTALMAAGVVFFLFYIHQNGGSRGEHYGATLINQMQVVQQTAGSQIYNEVENFEKYPQSFRVLARLLKANGPRSKDCMRIQYKDSSSGWIEAVKAPPTLCATKPFSGY